MSREMLHCCRAPVRRAQGQVMECCTSRVWGFQPYQTCRRRRTSSTCLGITALSRIDSPAGSGIPRNLQPADDAGVLQHAQRRVPGPASVLAVFQPRRLQGPCRRARVWHDRRLQICGQDSVRASDRPKVSNLPNPTFRPIQCVSYD